MATMMATVARKSKCNRFDWQKNNFLHVQHTFLYISLLSLHGYGLRIPNFMLYGGRKQATRRKWSPRNQIQGDSSTFDIFSKLE